MYNGLRTVRNVFRMVPNAFRMVQDAFRTVRDGKRTVRDTFGTIRGYPEEVLGRVSALMELQFEILRSGRGWERLADQLELPRRVSFRPRMAPGYLETTIEWTLQHVGLEQGAGTSLHFLRRTRPGLSPVGEPLAKTVRPFTQTRSMPVASACGSLVVARSITVAGSKSTRSA